MAASAVVLANGLFRTDFAKTAHGLVRGPSRYPLVGVVDASCAGQDAGELLDGRHRDIPVLASVAEALERPNPPTHCLVGVATRGGVLTPDLRAELIHAGLAGMDLWNGLHLPLADDGEIVRAAQAGGAALHDFRRPRPAAQLRFWTGEILKLTTPRLAVLGTDCALGKRTTSVFLRQALKEQGVRAEMIYTGQTGWLQGIQHGFFFDATPNDFVSGELEGAILDCQRDLDPDVILLEGQAALRHPAGPCGSEFIVSAATAGVILQHAPARTHFADYEELGCRLPPLREEIELIRLLGSEVWAVTLSEEGLTKDEAEAHRERLMNELGLPVFLPLSGGVRELTTLVIKRLALKGRELGAGS
jgi:uncharacterized NAD-dependent epimerase/dehydratase family protein